MCEFISGIPDATPNFRHKYRRIADPSDFERIVKVFRYQLEVARIDPKSKVVLDAGCGSGIYSLFFLLFGAKQVTAIDLFDENVAALGALARKFGMEIRPERIDVADTRYPDSSFDIIFCNEAISHFHDWRTFVVEASRLLARPGRILIADWNNGANPWVRREVHDFWERSECGPFLASDYEPGKQNMPYLFRRWMIIRRTLPTISDEAVFHLGLRTSGKGGAELLAICEEFAKSGVLPRYGYRRGVSQSRPEDAQSNEEPVDPRDLVRLLAEGGIRAQARAHFGLTRSRALPILNSVATALGGAGLFAAKKYIVFGEKV
jgi:SAM-dependent methyltransferase